jgi:hypothetical protein
MWHGAWGRAIWDDAAEPSRRRVAVSSHRPRFGVLFKINTIGNLAERPWGYGVGNHGLHARIISLSSWASLLTRLSRYSLTGPLSPTPSHVHAFVVPWPRSNLLLWFALFFSSPSCSRGNADSTQIVNPALRWRIFQVLCSRGETLDRTREKFKTILPLLPSQSAFDAYVTHAQLLKDPIW